MHTFGLGRETLAKVAVKNHYNGARNRKAHLRMEITEEQVLKAPIIAWPFGLFDCCPTTDGAAAAIVCRADLAKRVPRRPRDPGEGRGLAVDHGAPVLRPHLRLPRLPLDAEGGAAGLRDGGHHGAGHRLRRGARLLHLDRDLQHRGPRLLREGRRAGGWSTRDAPRSTATSRSTRAAASSRSATRSAPAACA